MGEMAYKGKMMRLKDYISKDFIFIIHEPGDKYSFLKQLVVRAKERFVEIDEAALLKRLIYREGEVSTGIGHGVAIPHATVESIEKSLCIVAQTPEGLDFESLDASLVLITFLLLSPPDAMGSYLKLLARVARLASSEKFVHAMATAKDEDELFALIEEEDSRHV